MARKPWSVPYCLYMALCSLKGALIPVGWIVGLNVGEKLDSVLSDVVLKGILWPRDSDYTKADEKIDVIAKLILVASSHLLVLSMKLCK